MATHNTTNTDPPSRVATGANAMPITQVGTSRNTGKTITDPVTQGFERMMERFDKLESRIEILETPAIHDPRPRYNYGVRMTWSMKITEGNSGGTMRSTTGTLLQASVTVGVRVEVVVATSMVLEVIRDMGVEFSHARAEQISDGADSTATGPAGTLLHTDRGIGMTRSSLAIVIRRVGTLLNTGTGIISRLMIIHRA